MNKYLFIGGPLDGQRREVPNDYDQYRVTVAPPPDFSKQPRPEDPFNPIEHLYAAVRIRGPLATTKVFWHQDGTSDPIAVMARKYPEPGTINVSADDIADVVETCETPVNAEDHARFLPAMRRLYAALYNHRLQQP